MSAFSERPFVAGSLTGLRAFYVDRYGRLVSPVWGQRVFTPGDNTAECGRNQNEYGFFSGTWTVTLRGFESPAEKAEREERDRKAAEPHDAGAIFCGCGFYAYFDGKNDYLRQDRASRVGAIVEGFGTCTVGTRGFRASQARLVALIEPAKEFADPARWERVKHNYLDVPVYESKRAALAAHPLHETAMPTPETVDNFWSLAVSR